MLRIFYRDPIALILSLVALAFLIVGVSSAFASGYQPPPSVRVDTSLKADSNASSSSKSGADSRSDSGDTRVLFFDLPDAFLTQPSYREVQEVCFAQHQHEIAATQCLAECVRKGSERTCDVCIAAGKYPMPDLCGAALEALRPAKLCRRLPFVGLGLIDVPLVKGYC